MKTKIFFPIIFAFSFNAAATGGMIGGGEVTYRALMTCSTEGIDPTFPASPSLIVAKETHYDGREIEDAPLRIVTLDENSHPNRFYVTEQTELLESPDGDVVIPLWRYPWGSDGNAQIGEFVWSSSQRSGALRSFEGNEVEELVIRDCVYSSR
jgi:hypothetical protein